MRTWPKLSSLCHQEGLQWGNGLKLFYYLSLTWQFCFHQLHFQLQFTFYFSLPPSFHLLALNSFGRAKSPSSLSLSLLLALSVSSSHYSLSNLCYNFSPHSIWDPLSSHFARLDHRYSSTQCSHTENVQFIMYDLKCFGGSLGLAVKGKSCCKLVNVPAASSGLRPLQVCSYPSALLKLQTQHSKLFTPKCSLRQLTLLIFYWK